MTYCVVQALHLAHHYLFIFVFFQIVYTLNIFFISTVKLFTNKFGHIKEQLSKLERNRPMDNQKLEELIWQFHFVNLELVKINDYFKFLFLTNLVHFFLLAVLCAFVSFFFAEIRLKLVFFVVVFMMYLAIFGLPFKFANILRIRVSCCLFNFQI